MLDAQKKLLAEIEAVEKSALALFNRGVKIASIVQKLRAAREEAQARVRYLEKHSQPSWLVKPKPAPIPAAKSVS